MTESVGTLGALWLALKASIDADAGLIALSGGSVRSHLEQAPTGETWPYIVCSLSETGGEVMSEASLGVSLYTQGTPTVSAQKQAMQMLHRIKVLFHHGRIEDTDEVGAIRVSSGGAGQFQDLTGEQVPDWETKAHHYSVWDVEYVPTLDWVG